MASYTTFDNNSVVMHNTDLSWLAEQYICSF